MFFMMFVVILYINSVLSLASIDLFSRLNEMNQGKELDSLVQDIIHVIHKDLTCLAIICDNTYQEIFTDIFFFKLGIKSFLKILVEESEDLLAPNYHTVKVIEHIRKAGCNFYVILLANGDQASRLLRFGDRHRLIDTRAKYLMIYDHRLYHPHLHYLWKKIVNIIFVRQYKQSARFELSTVPFPTPIRNILIPRRLDTWRAGKFQTSTSLYRDKTKELDGQTLSAVTIQHMPSAVKMVERPSPTEITIEGHKPIGFGGLEIEMLNSLKAVMNFKSIVYEPLNSESEAWGEKQLNGSYSGLLGEICNGHADIALGNLYYTPYHLELLDLSVPYATECLTFLTPEALSDNSWQTLILPFRLNMWIGILVTLIVGAAFFYIFANIYNSLEFKGSTTQDSKQNKLTRSIKIRVKQISDSLKTLNSSKEGRFSLKRFNFFKFGNNKKSSVNDTLQKSSTKSIIFHNIENKKFQSEGMYLFDSVNNSLLYTFGMLALVSLPTFTSGWALRVMTGCWWIYCILIVVAYRASLTAILASPQPRVTIDTVEELALSPVKCGGWGKENQNFFTTSLDFASREIGKKFEIVKDPEAKDAIAEISEGTFSYYGNIYFLRSARVKQWLKLRRNNKNQTDYENSNEEVLISKRGHNLHIMSNCVINMPVSIGLQKNSPLKPQVDKFIRLFIESGLIKKWLNDVMMDTFIAEAPLTHEQVKALVDLRKLYAGFVALFIGYIISILVLLFENIHWYFIVKKNPLFDKYYLVKYYSSKK